MKPILEVQHVGKKFRIQHLAGGYLSLRERLVKAIKFESNEREDFWALNDVSFTVQPGESVGIIGRNGAGKSTLLKILSKITPPTTGRIISRGRIASLLEVGTGFHPELTGRENIFFNGSLLGMKRKEIEIKFDEIVDFSGVEKFLDTPLKHFSSGMQLRLAFAVAAFLEPEILIIDEVLAVGDAEFQKKCLGKMEDVSKSGRTILFVSHNMGAVQSLCSKAVMLENGTVTMNQSTHQVISYYQNQLASHVSDRWIRNGAKSGKALRYTKIEAILLHDQPTHILQLNVTLLSVGAHADSFVAFDFKNSLGITFMQAIPTLKPFISSGKIDHNFIVHIELPPLVPDKYYVSAWVGAHNLDTSDFISEAVSFDIIQSPTPGRSFPHTHDHGMIVPASYLSDDKK
jgi:lipopolysaccharide transport system ATP-binding protein